MKRCSNCGNPVSIDYARCFKCHDFAGKAKPGDRCNVCDGLMLKKNSRFGDFLSCSNWKSHYFTNAGEVTVLPPAGKGGGLGVKKGQTYFYKRYEKGYSKKKGLEKSQSYKRT